MSAQEANEQDKQNQASNLEQPQPQAEEEEKYDEKEQEINYDELKPKLAAPTKEEIVQQLAEDMQKLYEYNDEAAKSMKTNEDGSITFCPTPNIELGKRTFNTKQMGLGEMLNEQECVRPLAYSNPKDEIVPCEHFCSFIDASITAWSQHYPLRLRPQHIWLLILQSVAIHVDQNAEKLRNKYVKHDGKKKLVVQISAHPDESEWASTIDNFADQIDKNTVADTAKLFECDFNKSSAAEKIATKVTMMDICKNYFDYSCQTDCGFPQITLDGTQNDWLKLKSKVLQLLNTKVDPAFGKKWGDAMLPVLDRFIIAYDKQIDCVFWNSMIKRGSIYGSGAYSWFCGWFNVFFPMINKRWNRFCQAYSMDKSYVRQGLADDGLGGGENDTDDYPKGLATAPVEWDNNGKITKLKFIAGFIGYKQNKETLELTPNVGWCVAHEMNERELDAKRKKEEEEEDW